MNVNMTSLFTYRKLRSVLIVDDDHRSLNIGSVVLSSMANLQVYACKSSEEALTIAKAVKPDLLLLAQTPDTVCAAALAAIRNLPGLFTTQVIFLASENQGCMGVPCSPEAIGTIRKPFEPLLLPEQVLQLWERSMTNAT